MPDEQETCAEGSVQTEVSSAPVRPCIPPVAAGVQVPAEQLAPVEQVARSSSNPTERRDVTSLSGAATAVDPVKATIVQSPIPATTGSLEPSLQKNQLITASKTGADVPLVDKTVVPPGPAHSVPSSSSVGSASPAVDVVRAAITNVKSNEVPAVSKAPSSIKVSPNALAAGLSPMNNTPGIKSPHVVGFHANTLPRPASTGGLTTSTNILSTQVPAPSSKTQIPYQRPVVYNTTPLPSSITRPNVTQPMTVATKLSSPQLTRQPNGSFISTQSKPTMTPMIQTMKPMTTPAAQAQYNLALQARAAVLAAQNSTSGTHTVTSTQQYIRTQPGLGTPLPVTTYKKPEMVVQAPSLGSEPMQLDGPKDVIDEAENERTRLENRERKKRWREANEDRNKDNDLRCRVNKRAHKLYGKEPSKAKDLWIEEEFTKRKSKRQEKEGKGPDGNLLIEGTDLSSLNHFEMNSVIMSTLSEFAKNPAAPALKDNADLNAMLHRLRTEPQSIKSLFTGQPKANHEPQTAALTNDNMQKMNAGHGHRQMSNNLDEDDEDDDDKFSQNGSVTHSVVDLTALAAPITDVVGCSDNVAKIEGSANNSVAPTLPSPNVPARPPAARRMSTASNEGQTQHHTYGIGSGFEPQVALTLSSELFRLISMQPETKTPVESAHGNAQEAEQKSLPSTTVITNVKQEVSA